MCGVLVHFESKEGARPPPGHHMTSQPQSLAGLPFSASPPTFALHVPVSGLVRVHGNRAPPPRGREGPCYPCLKQGYSPPSIPHPYTSTHTHTSPNERLWLGMYTPPPQSQHIPWLTSCVCSYRLIQLEVLCAFAHLAWRSHRNAEQWEHAKERL